MKDMNVLVGCARGKVGEPVFTECYEGDLITG